MKTYELKGNGGQVAFGETGNLGQAVDQAITVVDSIGFNFFNFALTIPTGATVTFEGSYDGDNFFTIALRNVVTGIYQRTADADGNFSGVIQGLRKARVRVSDAGTAAGSVIGTATKTETELVTANNADTEDPLIKQAQEEIFNTYGDVVRVKPKALLKFGRNDSVDTTEETVWLQGGEETYATDNDIDTISSSNVSDDQEVKVEGHTVDGSGNFTFVVQTATLNGRNKVTLATPLARATRIFNNDDTDFNGTVYVYEDGAITNGVPNTAADIHLQTDGANNQSLKAATTFSENDYGIITSIVVSVNRQNSRSVDFRVKVREKGKVFRTKLPPIACHSQSGTIVVPLAPYLIVPPNSDIKINAISSGSATGVGAGFNSYLGLKQT